MNHMELRNYAENEIHDLDGNVSLLVYDFTQDDALLAFDVNRKLVSASMIKTPILMAALEQVRQGKLSLEQPIPVPCSEVLEDTEVFNCGQKSCPLEELLTWMIINSDNTATNILIELLGMDALNEYFRELELRSTVLERKMLDWAAIRAGRNNYTSAKDQLAVFSSLYHKSVLTPELCDLALNILSRQRDFSIALRYLCAPELTFAHKTGGLDHLNHDAGIFSVPGHDYFFGCFVTDALSDSEKNPVAKRLIGRLSKAVYNYYKNSDENRQGS